MLVAEARRTGGEHDIACHREFESTGQTQTVYRSDDRQARAFKRGEGFVSRRQEGLE